MKKIVVIAISAALICIIFLVFISCDKNYEIAMITNGTKVKDGTFNQPIWEEIKDFAKENKVTYGSIQADGDSEEYLTEAIKQAVNNGAKVIVCPGESFETVIYNIQDTYPEIRFLLLDGEPNDKGAATPGKPVYKTSQNVHCIRYKEEQSGYLAGYAAVISGYRNLGFVGGEQVNSIIRYGYGYIQGADSAASDLNLEPGTVTIKYWYADTFSPDDSITEEISTWYSEGTEVVFSCGGEIIQSVISAAKNTEDGKIIGVDVDQSKLSDRIITSAMKNLGTSIKTALTSLYENNLAWNNERAGQTVTLGASADCVGLPTNNKAWKLTGWPVEEYENLYSMMKNGNVAVDNNSDPKIKPITKYVTVEYKEPQITIN